LYSKGDASIPVDYRAELHKLNRSVMRQFAELLEVLIRCPSHHKTMVEDIELMLINMHDLLNSFRPHQAREIVIDRLKQQIEQHKTATKELQECIDRSNERLQGATASLTAAAASAPCEDTANEGGGDAMDTSAGEEGSELNPDHAQRRNDAASQRLFEALR
jgi:mediator of RNA polymerase II transcription subunit 7